jgi:hypothetical protein
VLRKAKRSGVHASQVVPTIDVGLRVWNSPTTWYASGIAHEGYHIKLYREAMMRDGGHGPKLSTWVGAEAEVACLGFQLRVLEELNAESWHLEYVRELIKSPNYQSDPFSFKDYLKRTW